MASTRHLLTLRDLAPSELSAILDLAHALKTSRGQPGAPRPLLGKSVAMIFSKSSTRTRVSFQVGIAELGGHSMYFGKDELQLGRGESMADTARVLSRYLHGVVIRYGSHEAVEDLASHASIPVINALTDKAHPCQALADLQTIREHAGSLAGVRVCFLGDGANNVAFSLIGACRLAGMHLTIGAPSGYLPDESLPGSFQGTGTVEYFTDPVQAVKGAQFLYTDVWVSMGFEAEAAERLRVLQPYQLNARLLAQAAPGAKVLHCLPAYRGKEITAEVLDGPQSIVWDQAENRLHAQKAVLATLIH